VCTCARGTYTSRESSASEPQTPNACTATLATSAAIKQVPPCGWLPHTTPTNDQAERRGTLLRTNSTGRVHLAPSKQPCSQFVKSCAHYYVSQTPCMLMKPSWPLSLVAKQNVCRRTLDPTERCFFGSSSSEALTVRLSHWIGRLRPPQHHIAHRRVPLWRA